MAHNEQKQNNWLQRWQLLLQESEIADNAPARGTRVQRLEVTTGQISAQVKDRELGTHLLSIRWPPLNGHEWSMIVEKLIIHTRLATQLLAGEVPLGIEAVFHDAGYDLLPSTVDVWVVDCSPIPQSDATDVEDTPLRQLKRDDFDSLIVAVYQLLGEVFHDDPWLILRLRGRDRQQFIDALHAHHRATQNGNEHSSHATISSVPFDNVGWGAASERLHHAEPAHPTTDRNRNAPHSTLSDDLPLEESIDSFWGAGKRLRNTQHHIAPPLVDQLFLRRLGPPNFAEDGTVIYNRLSDIYQHVTHQAMLLAYADDGEA